MTSFELSPGKWVGKDYPCFVVVEIGQNHQGDIEIAKRMIEMAKDCGADCVKFQKCQLHEKFTRNALERPYNSVHSWASTYGEHKAFLEFTVDQFKELKKYADDMGILFSSSAGDEVSFDFLDSIGVPFFKISSSDAGNFDLVKHVANKGKPLIVSTGMQDKETVHKLHDILKDSKREFALLQCTSAYPLPPEDVNLHILQNYQQEFPDIVIGYSGHETGIAISVAAVAMGAKIVERHVTLDHQWKGNDHRCSLEPSELRTLIQDIRTVEKAMGCSVKRRLPVEMPCYNKLGKSIVAATELKEGDVLCNSSLAVKVAHRNGISPEKRTQVLGKRLKRSIERDEPVMEDDVDWTS